MKILVKFSEEVDFALSEEILAKYVDFSKRQTVIWKVDKFSEEHVFSLETCPFVLFYKVLSDFVIFYDNRNKVFIFDSVSLYEAFTQICTFGVVEAPVMFYTMTKNLFFDLRHDLKDLVVVSDVVMVGNDLNFSRYLEYLHHGKMTNNFEFKFSSEKFVVPAKHFKLWLLTIR